VNACAASGDRLDFSRALDAPDTVVVGLVKFVETASVAKLVSATMWTGN